MVLVAHNASQCHRRGQSVTTKTSTELAGPQMSFYTDVGSANVDMPVTTRQGMDSCQNTVTEVSTYSGIVVKNAKSDQIVLGF